jgi:hypothetical protein
LTMRWFYARKQSVGGYRAVMVDEKH